MGPSMLAHTQILGMSPQPFFHGPHGFASTGGSQPSQEETEPDVETVPETQLELVAEAFNVVNGLITPKSNLPSLVERC
ncbi:hypothetical protein Hanom_Chr13g01231661 [Helianthus anomalus]